MISTNYKNIEVNPNTGFFIINNSFHNAFTELVKYCQQNPHKWVYYREYAKDPFLPEYVLGVVTRDTESIQMPNLFHWTLVQSGKE